MKQKIKLLQVHSVCHKKRFIKLLKKLGKKYQNLYLQQQELGFLQNKGQAQALHSKIYLSYILCC